MLAELIKEYLLEQEKKTKLDHLKANYLDDKKPKKSHKIPDETHDTHYGISNPEKVDKKSFKRRKKIPETYLLEIIKADPTSVVAQDALTIDKVEKVGAYTQWIVNRYFDLIPEDYSGKKDSRYSDIRESVRLFFEDLYKVKNDLIKFNRFKGQLAKKDITQIKTTDELYELTKDINLEDAVLTHKQKQEKLKNADVEAKKVGKHNAHYVYEDNKWQVLIPKTAQAAADISADPLTRWCTAVISNNHYASYTKKGPLYIIRDKTKLTPTTSKVAPGEPTPLYQFEFTGGSYYDKDDKQINVAKFLNEKNNEGLKQFFKPMFEKAFTSKEFDIRNKQFQEYVSMYGANDDILNQIKHVLKIKLGNEKDVYLSDSESDKIKPFIDMLGYKNFLKATFEYLSADVEVLEIMLTEYDGSGFDVPDSLTEKQKMENLILSGFIKSLPKNIGSLTNLVFCSLENNSRLKQLPTSFASLTHLHVLNITKTAVDVPQSLVTAAENDSMILLK